MRRRPNKMKTKHKTSFVLMAVRPPFSQQLVNGQKHHEYRSRRPAFPIRTKIFIYETRPTMAIIGTALVIGIIDNVLVTELPEDVQKLFKTAVCHAAQIDQGKRFERHIPWADIRNHPDIPIVRVPQSYMYINEETAMIIEKLGENNV